MKSLAKRHRNSLWQATVAATVGLPLKACSGTTKGIGLEQIEQSSGEGTYTSAMGHFLGVPLAKLLWTALQPVTKWSRVLNTTSFCDDCAHDATLFSAASNSEDCLHLTVYLPKQAGLFSNFLVDSNASPVMVFIYGGRQIRGIRGGYDATALVAMGVTVVALNYRLGPQGFLTHLALSEAGTGTCGNYDLWDQQAALPWVKNNIRAFCSDLENLTIFGQCAGDMTTLSHLASVQTAGMFLTAIVESGTYVLAPPALDARGGLGQGFAAPKGCRTASARCLRRPPLAKILASTRALSTHGSIMPTVNGRQLPCTFSDAFGSGNFNQVPVNEVSKQDECSILSLQSIDPVLGHGLSKPEFVSTLVNNFSPEFAPVLRSFYQLSIDVTPAQTFDNVTTDAMCICNGRALAKMLSTNVPVYTSKFTDSQAPAIYSIPPHPEGHGTHHATELQYMFPHTRQAYFDRRVLQR